MLCEHYQSCSPSFSSSFADFTVLTTTYIQSLLWERSGHQKDAGCSLAHVLQGASRSYVTHRMCGWEEARGPRYAALLFSVF